MKDFNIVTSIFNIVILILNTIGLFRGPIRAVQIQDDIARRREQNERKINLFKTLMATRGDRVSLDHTKALNMIDMEFYDDESVKSAWEKYLNSLSTDVSEYNESKMREFYEKRDDLFVGLLQAIAKLLRYDFSVDHLKRGIYVPQAHADLQSDQVRVRKAVIDVFEGKKPLTMQIAVTTDDPLRSGLIDLVDGKRSLKIQNDNVIEQNKKL